jgi:hypothetical protein
MRLSIAITPDTKELNMELRGEEVVVTDGMWDIITFRVNDDDQLVFARNMGVEDEDFLTDEEGKLIEVDEDEE